MSDDVIRDALRAAENAVKSSSHTCFSGDQLALLNKCATTKAWNPCVCERQAAAAVAAFLRALPDQYTRGGAAFWDAIPVEEETRLWLAAAVERAAQEADKLIAARAADLAADPAGADTQAGGDMFPGDRA